MKILQTIPNIFMFFQKIRFENVKRKKNLIWTFLQFLFEEFFYRSFLWYFVFRGEKKEKKKRQI